MAQAGPPAMPPLTAQTRPVDTALISLHYAYPATVFGYFAISSAVAICILSERKEHPRRRTLLALMLFTVLSYLAQIATTLVSSFFAKEWLGQQDAMISWLSCILVFGLQFAMLSDDKCVVWYPFIGPYLLALVFEPALEFITLSTRPAGQLSWGEIAGLSVVASRYLAIGLVVTTFFVWRGVPEPIPATDAEQQPLIPRNADGTPAGASNGGEGSSSPAAYGSTATTATSSTVNSSADNSESEDTAGSNKNSKSSSSENANELPWERRERKRREEMEKRLRENGNWFDYAKRFRIFIPYIWPLNNRRLQIRAVLVGVCLIANNALNVLIPRQLGIIMDSLSHANDKNPWVQVVIFAGLKFASSQAGISLLRQWLWLPVEYYSFGAMSIAAYSHVLNLSSDFHDSKSSSDIMMAISSGQSISSLLESICFSALPMLIDMSIAFIYLSATFGPYEGFITFATATIFLYIAGRMISSLKTARRGEVSAWFEEHYVRQAGIQGWSTVASFNQVGHEEQRYSNAVKNRVTKSQNVYIGYLMAYAFQYLVLLAGLLAGAFLAVWQVTSGQSTPGQFVMLLTYWTQLVAPLTFFAGLGKSISKNFIHAEQLLEIMNTKPTVVSKQGAPELQFSGGDVKFENVSFSYNDKKAILKNVTFHAPSGLTIAFVGATGAGKSTILKLLDRFYDVTEGCIKIDGQDIRDVDLQSLRSRIGIVPQSPVLFNDTVMNNVRYARLDATDEEVFDACRAAAIHEQILGFSDGYDSRVGERGIKLSGGELQRIAIARAILKNPSIVLLDEATSSVDTETEQKIQQALQALCAGRTTFVVAHRLSTVMNADCIIVISNGEVVEKGSHDDLILASGRYASLWSKQIFMKPKDKLKAVDGLGKTSDLVNDLPLETTASELAKAKRGLSETPTAGKTSFVANGTGSNSNAAAARISGGVDGVDEPNGTGNGKATKGDDDSGSETATETNTPPGRKNEENRLNPVAPPFTPRAFPAQLHVASSIVPTNGSASLSAPVACDTQSTEAEPTQPATGDGVAESRTEQTQGTSSVSSTTPDRCGFDRGQRSTEATDIDGADGASETQAPPELADCNPPPNDSVSRGSLRGRSRHSKVRWSRPRYSRRVQSKSEPSPNKEASGQ